MFGVALFYQQDIALVSDKWNMSGYKSVRDKIIQDFRRADKYMGRDTDDQIAHLQSAVPEHVHNGTRRSCGVKNLGQTFVLLTANFDLSVGGIVGLSTVIASCTMEAWMIFFE